MDTIRDEWGSEKRIGNCIPVYNKEKMIEIEDYIINKCSQYNLQCKYNVGVQIGGIPPKGDKTPIVNPAIHAIRYHDMLGGILISTRNAELNCRNVDNILFAGVIDKELVSSLLSQLTDKYALDSIEQRYEKVIFLPGSNIRHIIDGEKIEEILIDYPETVVKPHPIQTEEGIRRLKELYQNHLVDQNVSGFTLLQSCTVLWSTANSEIGLMAALLQKPFGDITLWKEYYNLLFAPLYRQFKYKNVVHNYEVITKFLSSDKSGYVAPWMNNWKPRVDSYFEYIMRSRTKNMNYPYNT